MDTEHLDPFSNEAWAAGQDRIDWEKCRNLESDGSFPTVWPTNLLKREMP